MHPNPAPPESDLALLLKQGTDYAESAMRKLGHVPLRSSPSLQSEVCNSFPARWRTNGRRSEFANTARLVCADYEARAALLVLESWMKVVPLGQPHDPDELPSEALDRHEIILLMARDERPGSRWCFGLCGLTPEASSG